MGSARGLLLPGGSDQLKERAEGEEQKLSLPNRGRNLGGAQAKKDAGVSWDPWLK